MKEADSVHPGEGSPGAAASRSGALVHRDGHRVTFLEEGVDEGGDYLLIEHVWTRPGMMAGPHWHPVLTETFRVREGRMRFRVDGSEFFLGLGERTTVRPGEVHRFWNTGEGRLRVVHEVRPPGHHRQMLVILLVGALFIGLAPWRWATGVGAFLGLFVTLGFLVSGGIPNLVGGDGSTFFGTPNPIERDTLGTVIGTWIQMIGVLTALIAGVIAMRNNYRKPTRARQ